MSHQKFGMTRNLVVGELLRVFEQKTRYRGTETNKKYELVIKDLIDNLFLPKSLQLNKRYLRRGLYKYKPRDKNIREFICQINKMVDYFEKFPPFGSGKHLPEDDTLKLGKRK